MAKFYTPELVELTEKCSNKTLAVWAADTAERVLPFFEKEYPHDTRPKDAIKALREWVKTGIFHMKDVRGASLASHAAAREVGGENAARFAARAAGQAIATAHVKTHALGAAYYAIKAIRSVGSEEDVDRERDWQYNHLVGLMQ